MLYNLDWLNPGKNFPPEGEKDRIKRYLENEVLFDGEHFGSELRDRNKLYVSEGKISVYSTQTDIGLFHANALINHICRRMIPPTLQVIQYAFPLA